MKQLPEWLQTQDNYTPCKDRDGFIAKSSLNLFKVLNRFKDTGRYGRMNIHASIKMIGILYAIILSSCSRNMIFVYILLAACILYMCQMPGKALIRVFTSACTTALISAIILIPAIFMGNPQTMLTVAIKVFLSVSLMGILTETTPWNQLTAALAVFHVPDIFVFTLDITLKYIVLLGDISADLLTALKLRSVGKNPKRSKSISGILGITFLKSKEMSEEMFQAMTLRGFEGEYRRKSGRSMCPTPGDLIVIGLCIAITILFIYVEVL